MQEVMFGVKNVLPSDSFMSPFFLLHISERVGGWFGLDRAAVNCFITQALSTYSAFSQGELYGFLVSVIITHLSQLVILL